MQEWVHPKLEEPHAGSGEGFLCSSSPHPVPKRALKPPGHLGASSGPSGHMVHAEGPVSPRSSLQGEGKAIPRVEAAPKAQDTRHGQPCVTLVVCNHCLTEVASVSPQGICTVVQVGESSCVLGLQAGLGWGKDTR